VRSERPEGGRTLCLERRPMRVFELSTHVQAIGRNDGTSRRRGWAKRRDGTTRPPKPSRSATAAAAYRACCVIDCDREGKTHDYTNKAGLEASEIVLPHNAPAWARDRLLVAGFWNRANLSASRWVHCAFGAIDRAGLNSQFFWGSKWRKTSNGNAFRQD